ncbi:MAG: type II secretion system minor pseudopilin GspK [Desulforhopalus sp.]
MASKNTMRRVVDNERGMALLITIMTVSLLIAITVQFHKTTWHKFLVSSNYKIGNQLKVIGDSGVNIGLALLQQDGTDNQFDTLLDGWLIQDQGDFSGLFAGGRLELNIVDLSGRLQVNSLVRKNDNPGNGENNAVLEEETRAIFTRLLLSGPFQVEDEAQASALVDALVDWIDEDDRESDNGAENGYYQSLEKPYSCKNGPVQSIDELLLVKGFSPQLLYGAVDRAALADYITVYGDDGKININTAPPLILQNLHSLVSEEMIVGLDSYRNDSGNLDSLADVGWYLATDGWPGDIVFEQGLLTTISSYFQITATGRFDTYMRQVVAIARRGNEGEVVLVERKVD